MLNNSETKAELKRLLLSLLEEETPTNPPRFPNHKDAVAPWVKSMAQGTFNGRPFSKHTVKSYHVYVERFLEKYGEISYTALETELLEIPIEQFGRRDKFYLAIWCFAKYLHREDSLPETFFKKAKSLKPKRHIPAKRDCLTEDQLNQLIAACQTTYESLLVHLISSTGLRASEFCDLRFGDLHLEEGYLVVKNGKWGKRRVVGLTQSLITLLKRHIAQFQIVEPDEPLFLDSNMQPLDRGGLLTRLYKIGERVNVHVSPHMLRRAFVTINANKGRSLVMLQMACGHADIKTTRSYCQTTEEEVIQAMQSWG